MTLQALVFEDFKITGLHNAKHMLFYGELTEKMMHMKENLQNFDILEHRL